MGIKSLNYQLTISTIFGLILFLMSANFAFGQAYILDPDTLTNSAQKLIGSGNFQGALDLLDKALEIDPDHVGALYSKGWALIGLNEQEKAIVWFDKALEVNPYHIHALNMKGNAFLGLNKPEEAIVWYDKALEVDPNYVHALNNKGFALYKLKQYEEAITSFNKVLEINPNYDLTKYNIQLAQNPPIHDFVFEGFQLLILIPIVFGVYLIQQFRKKKQENENLKYQDRRSTVDNPF